MGDIDHGGRTGRQRKRKWKQEMGGDWMSILCTTDSLREMELIPPEAGSSGFPEGKESWMELNLSS